VQSECRGDPEADKSRRKGDVQGLRMRLRLRGNMTFIRRYGRGGKEERIGTTKKKKKGRKGRPLYGATIGPS